VFFSFALTALLSFAFHGDEPLVEFKVKGGDTPDAFSRVVVFAVCCYRNFEYANKPLLCKGLSCV